MTHALNLESMAAREQALKPADLRQELRRLTNLDTEPKSRGQDDDAPIDLLQYWNLLLRRKWTIVIAVVIALIAGLVVTYNTTPLYRSAVSLQVEPNLRVTGLETEQAFGVPYLNEQRYQRTQEEVLRSRALAQRVVDKLGLKVSSDQATARAPSYLAQLKNTIKGWLRGTRGKTTSDKPVAEQARQPDLAGRLLGGIAVLSDPQTQIMRVSYTSPNREEVAPVANAIAENFVAMNMERRYGATDYAEQFLKERIQQVRAALEDSEQRLVAYTREREIVDPDDKLGTLKQTLNALSEKLTQVEAERIAAESEYAQALEGRGPATLQIMKSEVIQALRTRKGELELQYQGLPQIYKADYPAKQQLQRQIIEIDQQIATEGVAIIDAIKADHEAKIREQASLQARVREVKSDILALRDRSTDYQVLKREVDANRQIYNNLLQRVKEIGVISGIASSNISIIDHAMTPGAPFIPDLSRNLTIALGIGLAGGILLAFLFDHLDDTIKTSEEVETRIHAPVLGVIPFVASKLPTDAREGHVSLAAAVDPRSPLAEAARSLTTALSFSTAEGAPKLLHVTSSGAGEGKTTVATSIAIAFARTGNKVLQIDADLRSPSLHHVLDLPNTSGLTNYLAGDSKPADIAQPTSVAGLFTITSGPLPPNPMELLASAKMLDLMNLVVERFDCVIIDGPPVIGLADAIVLSKLARRTIFVATVQHTRRGSLEGAVKRLHTSNANIIGAVINRFDQSSGRYGYGYSYDYHYTYDYGTRTASLPEQA